MKKDILLTLNVTQTVDEETESYEFVSCGQYHEKNNKKYITYEEGKLTGLDGYKTTLRIDGDIITMTRFGTPNSQMIFQKDERHIGFYNTPYGGLSVAVRSNEVCVTQTETTMDILLDYEMEFDDQLPMHNTLKINIREA